MQHNIMKMHILSTLFFSQLLSSALSKSIRGGDDTANINQRHLVEQSNLRQASPFSDTRIIGGDEASSGRYSYAVSLQDDDGHFCGGSLIAPDIILSAAHCAGGPYKVVMGRHDLDTNTGDEVDMAKEIPHPNYNDETTNYDFMVIVLDRPTNANVEMVKLNSNENAPNVNDPVTVMGWGDMAKSDDVQTLSDELMHVEVNAISNEECDASEGTIDGESDNYNGQITKSMLCATDDNEDSCQGDSGGPLVIKGSDGNGADDVQVGVVSWGIGCASEHFPGVYARISTEYDWIRSQVCNCSSDPPADFDCIGVSGSCGSSDGSNLVSSSGGGNNYDDDDDSTLEPTMFPTTSPTFYDDDFDAWDDDFDAWDDDWGKRKQNRLKMMHKEHVKQQRSPPSI